MEDDLDVVSQDGHLLDSVVKRKVSDADVFLALRDGEPVGYLRLEWLWSKLPYIEMIWVLGPYRRAGVGRALLAHVEAEVASRGHIALYSSSQADESEPQAWHRRMGFEDCGLLAGLNEGGVGEVFFRKLLAPTGGTARPQAAMQSRARTQPVAIRPFQTSDFEAVVALSLRAWEPVFDSIRATLAPAVYEAFYPDGWRSHQRSDVEAALADQDVWIAERDGAVVGFVSVVLHSDGGVGEVHMVAVDPDHQQHGVGVALTDHAVGWMRESGMKVAMVETGADPGHGPARSLYERSGFGLWAVARYFKAL